MDYTAEEVATAIRKVGASAFLKDHEIRAAASDVASRRRPVHRIATSRRVVSNPGDEYRAAWKHYIRGGEGVLTSQELAILQAERRDLSEGTTTAGGFTVPRDFLPEIQQALKWASGMRSVSRVLTTDNGRRIDYPLTDDTSNSTGIIATEGTAVTGTDPAFTDSFLALGAYTFGTGNLLKASIQLTQDSGVNLDSELIRLFGARIARAQEPLFTNGTGTGQPTGILPGATVGATLATGHTTSLSYDGILALYFSLDESYRKSASFMMNSTTLKAAFNVLDAQARPILQMPTRPGDDLSILGRPVVINESMPNPAANARTVLFGDFERAYIIRDVASEFVIVRLDERFADQLQRGYLGFARADGGPLAAAAVRCLVHSAT